MKRVSSYIATLIIFSTLTSSAFPLFTRHAEAVGTINNIIPSSTSVALLQCANQNGAISDALGSVFNGVSDFASGIGSSVGAGSSNQVDNHIFGEDDYGTAGIGDYTGAAGGVGNIISAIDKDGGTGPAGAETSGSNTVEPGAGFKRLLQQQQAAIEKDTASAKHSECLKSLGAAALHDLLAASTQDIVNWINTGFDGDPLFIQDPKLFFKGIADQEVYTFVAELNDPVKYPFGPEIAQSIADTYNCDKYTDGDYNCFNNNLVFTLSTEIGENWADFYSDFEVGGWNGWLAATQNPANNPIDFQTAATDEIQARIDLQQKNIEKELTYNGGFLSLRKCVAYKDGYSAEDTLDADYVTTDTGGDGTYDASSFDYEYSFFGNVDNCAQYAVTTPGSVVADQLNIHLGASAQAVAMGDEVNTSIAAIFDALTNQLIEEGLASLDDTTVVTQQIGGFGSNYVSTNTIGSSWYVDPYAPADLHTLLRCVSPLTGLPIPKCKTQIELTEDYLGALYEARDYLNYQLLSSLYLLDMHMPEPDIGWQTRMQGVLITKTTEINNLKSLSDISLKFIGPGLGAVAAIVAAIPGVGPIADAILFAGAALVAVVINLIENTDENVANGKGQAISILNQRYENELKRIQWDIDNNNLPSAFDARLQRDKIPAYEATYDAYVSTITQQEQILRILEQIEGDLGETEALTNGSDGTRSIDALRASYSGISGNIPSQSTIDSVKANQDLFETELPLVQEADAQILADLALQPFGGLDYTIPANLYHFWTEASIIADIAYAVGHCTLKSGDQDGFCPVDKNNSPIIYEPTGYFYDYDGDGDKARLQNYLPDRDNFYLVDYEAFAFGKAKGVSLVSGDGHVYSDAELMEHAHTAADFLRLYPGNFLTTTQRQNPYSIFYPYPIPPLSKSPWHYEKMYQHQEDDACLALKPIDLPYGTCAGDDPLLIYTRMNPTAFNTFDHVDAEDKSVDKEIYLNYFIDAYRNPNYTY